MATLRSQNKNQIILMEQVSCTLSVTADVRRKSAVHVSDSYVITWVKDLTEPAMVDATQDMADVEAEEDAHGIISTRIFALENWGEWHFLPDTGIMLLLWILYSGRSNTYTFVYCHCFTLFYIKWYCSILFPRGILRDLIKIFSSSD